MTDQNIARDDILALRSYKAGKQVDNTIRLNANEAPSSHWFDGDQLSLNRYPEVHPLALRDRMASLFGMPADNLLVTRGSSEAIDVLIRAYCRAYRDSVVTMPPTFEMYRVYAAIQGVRMIDVPLDSDNNFELDIDSVISVCSQSTKLIFLCSPNNPTGTSVPTQDILKIVRDRQGKSIVAIDEAYIEFSDQESMTQRVNDYDNLVVLRTLSKAHALAGARCGAAIASEGVVDIMSRILPPYSFPSPVIECVMHALSEDRIDRSAAAVSAIVAERDRVAERLLVLNCVDRTWPSQSNFILTRFRDLTAIQDYLLGHRILIRDCSSLPGLAECARITIGAPDENDSLLDSLKKYGGAA